MPEESAEGRLEKYCRVLEQNVSIRPIDRVFRSNSHIVATNEQVKKVLSYFYPERIVESVEIHTQPLNLWSK